MLLSSSVQGFFKVTNLSFYASNFYFSHRRSKDQKFLKKFLFNLGPDFNFCSSCCKQSGAQQNLNNKDSLKFLITQGYKRMMPYK